ncbi:ATP-dependent Clp protease adaptor ClpS [Nitrospina watsonii]|uniref:ATP-dependent Clp protease adapter protein ClpS n=1 Tax=Nitrospina watsonii TaxID=1323948 RepID=A0ABN8W0Z1_9BACT|nr:ATP-dependent Clp protease adaptor ClpS [Nitrospina watsonii]CAI2718123.1 ATP-dependent Clp protease adapter protein ClpS [Nitrospina watsonii]
MTTETLPETEIETLPEAPDTVVIPDSRNRTGYMPLYRVIMWDDDVTTMEFVIRMLFRVFGKDYPSAERLMLEVHYSGHAHVDTLPLERAEFKVDQVHKAAALENYPFRCTIEPL